MNWPAAESWAANLVYGGFDDWRLPTMVDTGTSGCNFAYTGTDCGFNVQTGSAATTVYNEMASLFYDTLGNDGRFDSTGTTTGCSSSSPYCLTNTGPFTNVQSYVYWSGLEYAPNTGSAWVFTFFYGNQSRSNEGNEYFAWPVRPGDVGSVNINPEQVTEIFSDPTTRPRDTQLRTLSDFDPEQPTVVVTHGWQPTGDYVPCATLLGRCDSFPLVHLVDEIADVAPDMNADDKPDVNIVSFGWEDAYVTYPGSALAKTGNAASLLADDLRVLLPDGYDESIHFIGHSYGSLVNAEAINRLQGEGLNIAQATLLDTPRAENLYTDLLPGSSVFGSYLYTFMPAGSVTYVENFVGDNSITLPDVLDLLNDGSAIETIVSFGAPLFSAGPDDFSIAPPYNQQLVPYQSHTGIHDDFYRELIGTDHWVSPALGEAEFESRRTGPDRIWLAVSLLDVISEIPSVLADLAHAGWEVVRGTASALFDGVIGLFENSPSMVAQEMTIPEDAELLQFDYMPLGSPDGDWLTVHFGDQLLYSHLLQPGIDEMMTATISMADFASETDSFYVTLNSVGESVAGFSFGDFRFIGSSSNPDPGVPEPGMLAMLCAGMAGLACFARRRFAIYTTAVSK